jgi:hypothetical protein
LQVATAVAIVKKWRVDTVVADANRGMSGLVSQALTQFISCQVRDAFVFEAEHRLLRLVESNVDAQS